MIYSSSKLQKQWFVETVWQWLHVIYYQRVVFHCVNCCLSVFSKIKQFHSNSQNQTVRLFDQTPSIGLESFFLKTEPFDNLGLHNVRCVGANSKVSFQVCSSFNSMVKSRKLPEILTFFKKTVDTLRSGATKYKSFFGICCVRTKPACQHFLWH